MLSSLEMDPLRVKFASLCRSQNKMSMCRSQLSQLLGMLKKESDDHFVTLWVGIVGALIHKAHEITEKR